MLRRRVSARCFRQGRTPGSFRTDQPLEWQVAIYHDLLVTAAIQVHTGRLNADTAVEALIATLQAAYRPLPPTRSRTSGQ
jgi:TetR/AcrR family transcriptional regulator, mexCD-oprJ operon repressor